MVGMYALGSDRVEDAVPVEGKETARERTRAEGGGIEGGWGVGNGFTLGGIRSECLILSRVDGDWQGRFSSGEVPRGGEMSMSRSGVLRASSISS